MPKDAAAFATTCIPYVEVDVIGDFDQISGIFCQESRVCSLTDIRLALPSTAEHIRSRSVDEPDKINLSVFQGRVCGDNCI